MTPLKVPYIDYSRIEATDEFIAKNNFILRTPEEIDVKFLEFAKFENPFDIRYEVLSDYASNAFMKEAYVTGYILNTEEDEKNPDMVDLKEVVQDFLDYMVFAWGKVRDENISLSNRMVKKLGIWLWLLNREDLQQLIEREDLYDPYATPALIALSESIGLVVPRSIVKFSKVKCE